MSEVTVTLEDYGKAHLALELVDPGEEGDVEVWHGIFSEEEDASETLWEVYFEMDPSSDYDKFDLISEAIYTYKLETEIIE